MSCLAPASALNKTKASALEMNLVILVIRSGDSMRRPVPTIQLNGQHQLK
jgi:hypothetical protein